MAYSLKWFFKYCTALTDISKIPYVADCVRIDSITVPQNILNNPLYAEFRPNMTTMLKYQQIVDIQQSHINICQLITFEEN